MNTGIFSGSFNPVHIGHLALANWLCEYEDLDEIWFLVTPQNPLKEREELMNYFIRFEMVQSAIAGYPKFKASDFESTLPVPSYTFRTLRALQAEYPENRFYLIMGADSWSGFSQWKESQSLISEFPIRIYPRPGYEQTVIPSSCPNVRTVNAPLLEISSTFIREAIREGRDIRFFLPEAIRGNINQIREMI
jgi:nicotinate-nucleotide adenylyltransferase